MKNTGKFAVTGGLAGLCNGLFGAGGGLFLVPLLTQWAGLEQRKAFATSVAVILPLSLVSAAEWTWPWPGPTCWEERWAACSPAGSFKRCPSLGCAGPLGR